MNTIFRTNLIATGQGVHSHEHPQIMIGQYGVMDCELPCSSGKLARGAIGLLPAEVQHIYRGNSDRCRVIVIDLDPQDDFIKSLEEVCLTTIESKLLSEAVLLKPNPSTLNLLSWVDFQIAQSSDLCKPQLQCQLISVFLTQLIMQGGGGVPKLENISRLKKVDLDAYIDKNLDRAIKNEELADIFYVSVSHLYLLIKQLAGLSPQQYITARRMLMAHSLLKEYRNSISIIAQRVGYIDTASFSHAFRRYFGCSPKSIRT